MGPSSSTLVTLKGNVETLHIPLLNTMGKSNARDRNSIDRSYENGPTSLNQMEFHDIL